MPASPPPANLVARQAVATSIPTASATGSDFSAPPTSSSSIQFPGGIYPTGPLNGGSPPSVYLICFVCIVVLLIAICFFVALRAILIRRRLHRDWAATGYADSYFDTMPEWAQRRAGDARWQTDGTLASAWRRGQERLGVAGGGAEFFGLPPRPKMHEIGLWGATGDEKVEWKKTSRGFVESDGSSDSSSGEMEMEKGKARSIEHDRGLTEAMLVASGGGEGVPSQSWDEILPVSSTAFLLPRQAPSSFRTQTPPPLFYPPPSFLTTLRTTPSRPPRPPPPPPPAPLLIDELLVPGETECQVTVIVAMPVDPEEEARRRKRRAEEAEEYGVEEEQEVPEVWLGTGRVRLEARPSA